MKKFSLLAVAAAMVFLVAGCGSTNGPSSRAAAELEEGFNNPPSEARPRVWWHWMNGNITKDGAIKDVEWMHRIGLGGFQTFDAALTTPQVVENRISYMTDEWKDVFSTVTKLADSYGMEMAIAGSPGWSESGGPWVEPKNAMKKVVWSEVDVKGGSQVSKSIPNPPTVSGTFQNIAQGRGGFSGVENNKSYYEDIAVIAIKLPANYTADAPKVLSNGGPFHYMYLTDGDLTNSSTLAYQKGNGDSWIMYEFPEARTVYGVTLVGSAGGGRGRGNAGSAPALESSNDGKTFTKVADLAGGANGVIDVAFPAVTAKYFRVVYKKPAAQPAMNFPGGGFGGGMFPGMGAQQAPAGVPVAEFKLHSAPRVNSFIAKAGFATSPDLYNVPTPSVTGATAKADVIDLTSKVDANGVLSWDAPAGDWKVIRFGYSLTGHQNSPASPEATGLEVDKLDKDAVTDYFNKYLDMYKDATGGLMGENGLSYVITDSWEAGQLNWTGKMFDEFQKRAGYDLHTWLPALAGYVVESAESTDKFLWDYRKVIADLTAENHYDALTDILAQRGMKRYTESHENSRAFVADGMQVKKNAEFPMSAMWTTGLGANGADIRESASVSHIYGQKFIAAESLTAGGNAWSYAPEDLKPTADMEMASGLNRFVIHESAHQPLDYYKPGLTLGPFGQWFNRHETWAEQAGPWISYLAKSSYMLSRGVPVVDILYYYGEDSNITALYGNQLPDLPEGYQFDFVNPDALMNDLGVKDGRITTPAGTTYTLIVLGDHNKYMSVPVLRALSKLVAAGAKVIGEKPVATPSLSDDEAEFNSLVADLWGGKILSGSVADALASLGCGKDVDYTKPGKDTKYLFQHRNFEGVQIYWLTNRTANAEDVDVTFRVSGLKPEIWNAMTGEICEASYKIADGKTTVKMHFDPNDALFVVFRSKTSVNEVNLPVKKVTPTAVQGPWQVAFLSGMGAPESTTFESLTDWQNDENLFIRYYSGTASYKKDINITAAQLDGEVWLNLGAVKSVAEVFVNGENLGILWKTPFRVNITSAVKEGQNSVEVKVTNLWVNRLIGDQRGDAGKYTYTTQAFYQPTAPLKSSGLLGPVTIENVK
ncbi:MAG: discoidin domain-containing protein [Bacteroidales bacterium]|nr:discoidin domain-containing protein [Bacteroidales bacterium]